MNLGTTRLRGRPRNRWQNEAREDGRIVDGEGWQEKVYNRGEWKKLLRTARNCLILHMPNEGMNESYSVIVVVVVVVIIIMKFLYLENDDNWQPFCARCAGCPSFYFLYF